jgi:hypothetical protein
MGIGKRLFRFPSLLVEDEQQQKVSTSVKYGNNLRHKIPCIFGE